MIVAKAIVLGVLIGTCFSVIAILGQISHALNILAGVQ